MKHMRMCTKLSLIAAVSMLVQTAAVFAQHEGDVRIGVDDTGKLAVEFDSLYELPMLDTPLLHGWGVDEPGFMSIETDDPNDGLFVLDPDANIEVEFVSADDALNMWTPPFFVEILDTPGERWALGGSSFDMHPFWQIDSDDPNFDPFQTEWDITLKVVDTRAGLGLAHADSDPFTVRFTPVPEPATLSLLAVAGVGLLRRRVLA